MNQENQPDQEDSRPVLLRRLDDAAATVEQIRKCSEQFQALRQRLESETQFDCHVAVRVSDTGTEVPMSSDLYPPDQLQAMARAAVTEQANQLGAQVMDLWLELYKVADQARQHVIKMRAEAGLSAQPPQEAQATVGDQAGN